MNVMQAVAAGIQALPSTATAFATTQAAWRFFSNPRVTLPILDKPLQAEGRRAAAESESPFVLVAIDWCKMDYASHTTKQDLTQISHGNDLGYELVAALLVDAFAGAPVSVASTTSLHFPGRVSSEWASALPMGRIAYDQRWSEPSLVSLM